VDDEEAAVVDDSPFVVAAKVLESAVSDDVEVPPTLVDVQDSPPLAVAPVDATPVDITPSEV
jgi:hypothetical protein